MRIFVGNRAHPGTTGMHVMGRPGEAVAALGSVPALKPGAAVVDALRAVSAAIKAGRDPFQGWQSARIAYDQQLREALAAGVLAPGKMVDAAGVAVPGEVTLICTCSREEAAAGRCHRAWLVPWLERAGWEEIYCDWLGVSGG